MSFKENKEERPIAFKLFVFFIVIYLLTASGLNFYHIDASELHIEVTRSLIERFDLSVPETVGMRGADGRYYSWLGIGSALLAVPFYIIGKLIGSPEIGVSIMNQIVGAATVALIFLFSVSLSYSKRTSVLIAVFYGLATMAWPYAKQPFDNVVETFFVLLSVYQVYLYTMHKKKRYLLLSAISLGVAFITRMTSILVILSLIIMMIMYYLRHPDSKTSMRMISRDFLLFSLAFLPFIGLTLWYNHYRFSSIFETGYSLRAAHTGIDFFTGTSLLTGLSGFLISPGKGFFYYSPVAILFFFGIKSFFKRHLKLALCFILIILSYLLFLSKNIYWHGDWAWGPRYLLVITPFLIIPFAELLESEIWLKNRFPRMIVYLIVAVSLIIQLGAICVDFNKYFITLRFMEKIKFTEVQADGVQPLFEPPIETYFNWHESPILAQFRFIHDIAREMKNYRYSKLPDNTTLENKFRADPVLNVFDFWWIYHYFVNGSYSGFIVALLLLLIAIYYASRLRKLSR